MNEPSRFNQLSSLRNENINSSADNDDINSIYRFLCSNVDNEMAIAATIAMYSLRLSANNSGTTNSSPQMTTIDLNTHASSNTPDDNLSNISNTLTSSSNDQQILVSSVSMSSESNDVVSVFIKYLKNFYLKLTDYF